MVTAGTADLPVAEECRATLGAYGIEADLVADVGVAGLHRLLVRAARLGEVSYEELAEIVADAWLSRASARRAAQWLESRGLR